MGEPSQLRQPWKAWYQPAQVPESDLSFVWPITLAAFASGNGAKCVKRNIDLEDGGNKGCSDNIKEEATNLQK